MLRFVLCVVGVAASFFLVIPEAHAGCLRECLDVEVKVSVDPGIDCATFTPEPNDCVCDGVVRIASRCGNIQIEGSRQPAAGGDILIDAPSVSVSAPHGRKTAETKYTAVVAPVGSSQPRTTTTHTVIVRTEATTGERADSCAAAPGPASRATPTSGLLLVALSLALRARKRSARVG